MNLELKGFQEVVRDDLLADIREAQGAARRRPQAVSLTAPTGSGKTVIITAVMERLVRGDESHPADDEVSFLWLSDQPELNTQSMKKVLTASSEFGDNDVVVVGHSFDAKVFAPGKIYFLNFQKLGRDKRLVGHGDKRDYTIWETIRNTIEQRPGKLIVILDEAHRGMIEDPAQRQQAATIAQKFVKGDADIPPVPVLVGMSATPKRFMSLVQGATDRVLRPVPVSPEVVRGSGLLKDVIRFYHPKRQEGDGARVGHDQSEYTILRTALRAFARFEREWRAYCENEPRPLAENEPRPLVENEPRPLVRPIMAIQVRDGTEARLSQTDLDAVLDIVHDELGHPGADALAHAFQEGTSLQVGNTPLRYLAPSDIQDDATVRVVLFKTSLTTGWDCPRAEVMMSFRSAADATLIAQLVGRMVRTPLARSVPNSELLNTVSLYLPYYDRPSLERVIAYLTEDEGDGVPPSEAEDGNDLVELTMRHGLEDCLEALAKVPTYTIPQVRQANEVHRLLKLARLVVKSELDEDAEDTARDSLVTSLVRSFEGLRTTPAFLQGLAGRTKVELVARTRQVAGDDVDETSIFEDVSAEDWDRRFDDAGRRLREGIHLDYVKRRAREGQDVRTAKLEAQALASDARVIEQLHTAAGRLADDILERHRGTIRKLDAASRARFDEIRSLAPDPCESDWVLPTSYSVPPAEKAYGGHLFEDRAGVAGYPAELTTWEEAVLREEQARSDFVAWYRNLPRKKWAMRIPYQVGTVWKPLFPDILVCRRDAEGEIVVDILDPHLDVLEDVVPKAKGLAQYAQRHGALFGRIELIHVHKGVVRRLDLANDQIRRQVAQVASNEHLRQLFNLLPANVSHT